MLESSRVNPLIAKLDQLEFSPTDAIHNFKWVKIIQLWQKRSTIFNFLLINVMFYLQHV